MKRIIGILAALMVIGMGANAQENASADAVVSGSAWIETHSENKKKRYRTTLEQYIKNVERCKNNDNCYVKLKKRKLDTGITRKQTYGYFCGKGHFSGASQTPLDSVDYCCKQHDLDGGIRGDNPRVAASKAVRCLRNIKTDRADQADFAEFGHGKYKGNAEEARFLICKRLASVADEPVRACRK